MASFRLARGVPRILSSTRNQIRLSSEGVHYNPPTGRIFGEQPPAKGQKREKADWENIYYYGMGGGMALGALLIAFKPDRSLETWATKEAQKNLAAKGETPTYERS